MLKILHECLKCVYYAQKDKIISFGRYRACTAYIQSMAVLPGFKRMVLNILRLNMNDIVTHQEKFESEEKFHEASKPEVDLTAALQHEVKDMLDKASCTYSGKLYNEIMKIVDMSVLQLLMARYRNNQSRAAKILGISRNTLRKKLKALFGDKY